MRNDSYWRFPYIIGFYLVGLVVYLLVDDNLSTMCTLCFEKNFFYLLFQLCQLNLEKDLLFSREIRHSDAELYVIFHCNLGCTDTSIKLSFPCPTRVGHRHSQTHARHFLDMCPKSVSVVPFFHGFFLK